MSDAQDVPLYRWTWPRFIVEHGERDGQPRRAFATFDRAEAFAHRIVAHMDGSWVSISRATDREAVMLDLVDHMGVVAMDGLGRVSTRLTWEGAGIVSAQRGVFNG